MGVSYGGLVSYFRLLRCLPADLVVAVTQEPSVPLIPPGASMEKEPSTNEASPVAKKESDAEILAWARKRGLVSFAFFFAMACIVALVWFLTR